jgi:hypothetical protein
MQVPGAETLHFACHSGRKEINGNRIVRTILAALWQRN